MSGKKARYSLRVFGRIKGKDACGGCVRSDKHLSTSRDKSKYPVYGKVEIDSELGKKMAKKYKITRIPAIERCRIRKDGSKGKCSVVQGWDRSRWT